MKRKKQKEISKKNLAIKVSKAKIQKTKGATKDKGLPPKKIQVRLNKKILSDVTIKGLQDNNTRRKIHSEFLSAKGFLSKIFVPILKRKRLKQQEKEETETKSPKLKKIRLLILNKKFFIPFGIATAAFLFWVFWGIPFPTQLASSQVPVSTKLFDRNGKLIYEIYADKRSSPVKIEDLPPYVEQATLSIEDKDFYKHFGISFSGIARAFYKTVTGKRLEGGSTLTQQLIKNTLLTPERTVKRKVREVVLTLVVEAIYTKKQILELYLNQIPYGSTAYGIGAASELYFGKQAKDLTLSEATLLAGLPASPTKYSPFGAHPELAKERQKIVLRRMVEDGHVTQEEADEAYAQNLNYLEQQELKAPHFALWVKEQLAEKYGEATVEKGGLRVTTTLDLDLQDLAQEAVATEVAKLKKSNVGNGAVLVTRPKTGEILTMVGSKDYFAKDEDGKVNIIFAKRQPGSSIKPLNYALAIEDKKITPSTVFADISTCFQVTGQRPYCPKNYDGNFHGAVQTRFALGNSYNIPAVRTLAVNGIDHFIDFATKMGITTFSDPSNYGLSLTLGGGEVMPYDMAVAFGVFANSGIKQPLISILKVTDWKGKVLLEEDLNKIEGERVLSQGTSFLISHILYDNNARVDAFGPSSFLVVRNHPEVSVKTGTTNDRKDNWTVGYSRLATVVTWVGNNDNTEMSGAVSGVSGASPIWNSVMKAVLDKAEKGDYGDTPKEHGWPRQPKEVAGVQVCATTGVVPKEGEGCQTRFEYFLSSNIPKEIKGGTQDVAYDRTTGNLAVEGTPPENIENRQQNVLYDPLGTMICLDCSVPVSSQSASIRYPIKFN